MSYYTYLSSFLAVYRIGSLRKAADMLEITQPAITKHLKSLEDMLGKKLFTRHAKGAEPTPIAHQLAKSVSPSLDTIDNLMQNKSSISETILVVCDIDVYYDLIKLAGTELMQPNAYIHFKTAPQDRFGSVLNDEYDFAITRILNRNSKIKHIPLFDEEHILVGSSKWLDSIKPSQLNKGELSSLHELDWLMTDHSEYFVKDYLRNSFSEELNITPHLCIDDLMALKNAAIAGHGVTVLPSRLCQDALDDSSLIQLYKPKNKTTYTQNLIWKDGRLKLPQYLHFKDLIIKAFSKL